MAAHCSFRPLPIRGYAASLSVLAVLAGALPAAAQWECPEAGATAASCGQAICPEDGVQSADALLALKAAVGTGYCAVCRCDVDASGATTASDSARILKSAVGQPLELTCPACNSLTLHPVEAELAGAGAGAGEPEETIRGVSTCTHEDGSMTEAWTTDVATDQDPPFEYADLGNVRARYKESAEDDGVVLEVHEKKPGRQTLSRTICRADKQVTLLWSSRCRGILDTNVGKSEYTPEGCPQNGHYFATFAAAATVVPPVRFASSVFWNPIAIEGLTDGRVALLARDNFSPARTHLIVVDETGTVVSDTIVLDGVYADGGFDCIAGSARCVASWDSFGKSSRAHATVLNADSGAAEGSILIKGQDREYDGVTEITTGAGDYAIGCDASHVCLAAWNLQRTTSIEHEFEDTEQLAVAARAFNARTGELGPELVLDLMQPDDPWGVSATSMGENRFRVTATVNGQPREYVLEVR